MVLSPRFAVLVAAIAVASAAIPSGFVPGSTDDLIIAYDDMVATDGGSLGQHDTQAVPVVGTAEPLRGTFAIIMVDVDIPINSPPQNSTLLRWMQLQVHSATTPTTVRTSTGETEQMYALINTTAPVAPYIAPAPAPPARIPLSRHCAIAIKTDGATTADISALTQAARSRSGFDADSVLMAAGLEDRVVAGGCFVVTNPVTSCNSSSAPSSFPTAGRTNVVLASSTTIIPGDAPSLPDMTLSIFGLVVAGAAALLM